MCLMNREYPGNVRELKHVISQGIINSRSPVIFPEDLPKQNQSKSDLKTSFMESEEIIPLADRLKLLEKEYCLHAIEKFDGDKKKAAQALDISLASLYTKIR